MTIDFGNLNLDQLEACNSFEQNAVDFIRNWFLTEQDVKVQTSGSTGVPKIISVAKKRMLNSAEMTNNFLNLKNGDSALLCLPVNFISGQMMIVRAIERKLILKIGNTTLKPLAELREPIDFCAMTPLQVENSLDQLHLIKKLIIGGAKVSEELHGKIHLYLTKHSSQSEVYETYGMSETLSHIALRKIYPDSSQYFTCLQNIEISKDERNCLVIDAPKLNSKTLHTNDIVEIKGSNQFRFIGRADFIINSGGLKISPENLESLVKKEISAELIFVGINDIKLGEKLVLLIEAKKDSELINKLSQIQYPTKNHQPKEILFIDDFPRSENGKILRLEIKKMAENLLAK